MDSKLTLKLNQQIIEKAKEYASSKKMSLSRIVEAYFQSLISKEDDSDFEISPFIRSISSGKKLSLDIDHKKAYRDYLDEKHK